MEDPALVAALPSTQLWDVNDNKLLEREREREEKNNRKGMRRRNREKKKSLQ
jgi:hypothetical protein